jgi:hypothetical protein
MRSTPFPERLSFLVSWCNIVPVVTLLTASLRLATAARRIILILAAAHSFRGDFSWVVLVPKMSPLRRALLRNGTPSFGFLCLPCHFRTAARSSAGDGYSF